MISLSTFSFLALLEIIFVLLIAVGVLFWRLRRRQGKDRIAYIDGEDKHPTPTLYLESEAARTRTHLESMGTDTPGIAADSPATTALSLRAGLLQLEAQLAGTSAAERDAAYWQSLADQLGDLLTTTGYTMPPASAEPEPSTSSAPPPLSSPLEEDASVSGLVEQQAKTIDFLRNYIQDLLDQAGHSPSPDPNIAEKFGELERANTELNQCVMVLEDENSFLRDQISALLQMQE